MMDKTKINCIEKLLNNKKIVFSKLLSGSFGINCHILRTEDKRNYIVKYSRSTNKKFNAINSETKNLIFLNNSKLNFFPKVINNDDDHLIMSYIYNNGMQPNQTNDDFLKAIVSLHSLNNDKYGFVFDTQIGGLKQINEFNDNWVNFYGEKRLAYIFNLINSSNQMDNLINKKIELLLKNLHNFIPNKPIASLLHGDLWEGNILFNNKNFVSFIDPGSFYGHNELEIAYLRWFNPKFIGKNFLEKYNDIIKLNKEYLNYEPIYQLYYSLLNVYLWDRKYVLDVEKLINKIKI